VSDFVADLPKLIASGVVGGLIASYATHRFTLWRERDSGRRNRLRDFRAFVTQFRSEAADRHHPQHTFAAFTRTRFRISATLRPQYPTISVASAALSLTGLWLPPLASREQKQMRVSAVSSA